MDDTAGDGPLGCKTSKPAMPAGGFGTLVMGLPGILKTQKRDWNEEETRESSYASQRTARASAASSPYAALLGMGAEPGMSSYQSSTGYWQCPACGFNNKPMNEICGGKGTLGCKLPRNFSPDDMAQMWQGDDMAQMWQGGDMGGMAPMMQGGGIGGMAQISQMFAGHGKDGKGKGKDGKGKDRRWKCSVCSFTNTPNNEVCGGKGGILGCKAPRPADWHCGECGFVNQPNNVVCGGTGPMGCKAPKPAEDAAEGAELTLNDFAPESS